MEPPHRFAFRWGHPDDAEGHVGNSLLVEFSLASEGESTHLRVVETGLHEPDLPDNQKATYVDEHKQGWDTDLPHLRDHATQQGQASSPR